MNKRTIKKVFRIIITIAFVVGSTAWLTSTQKAQATSYDGTGGTITHVGGNTIHTFTTGGTFNPGAYVTNVNYLVVAGGGGGGGGGGSLGGGGGGGGVLSGSDTLTLNQNYSIVIGGGGAAGVSAGSGSNGANSSFNGHTSIGGGGGGGDQLNGNNGGSGGGGNYDPSLPGGSGTAGQGNAGGQGYGGFPQYGGGGGGGGAAGTNSPAGANGFSSSISGSSQSYAGGGGGGSVSTADPGGNGGGGAGANRGTSDTSSAGTANTGGGGGGGDFGGPSNGGSGVVIISYVTPIGPVTCGSYSPAADWTTSTTANHSTTISGVTSGVSAVYIQVWTNNPWQSIYKAYAATNNGGGSWSATYPISDFPTFGQLVVYAEAYNGSTWVGCPTFTTLTIYNSTGTINVTSNMASTWTITCTLTNPTCPTYTPGSSKTTDTYTNVPYGSNSNDSPYPAPPWTITPTPIPGYTATVTPSSSQTMK